MAKIKTHNEDCMRILGGPFEIVHQWLDELAADYPPRKYLEYHRQFRHHAGGVEYVRKLWGPDAELAAKLHIIRDNDEFLKTPVIDIKKKEEIESLYIQALKYSSYPVIDDSRL